MASFKTAIATAIDAGQQVDVRDVAGRLKVFRARIDLAAQAVVAAGEDIQLFDLPSGFTPLSWLMHASATMGGTATLAVGITGTTGKYRAAAIFTAVDIPTPFGLAVNAVKLTAIERIRITIAAASLPAAGILIVSCIGMVGD